MSAVPGAPLPSESPSTPVNPWVQGAASVGVTALVVGVLVLVLGGPNGFADDSGPALVRAGIGASLALIGVGLLLSALVITGVGWYLRNPLAR